MWIFFALRRSRTAAGRIIAPAASLLALWILAAACAGPGRSVDPGGPLATLVVAADPALADLARAFSPPPTHRFATTEAQRAWRHLHVNVIDLSSGASLEPTSFSALGDTLRITGPFPGRRIALRFTNCGDLLTRTTVDSKGAQEVARVRIAHDGSVTPLSPLPENAKFDADDDYPAKRSLLFVLGQVPDDAAGTELSGLPPAGLPELLASHALLSSWSDKFPVAALHARFAPDSEAHPLRRNVVALASAIAGGELKDSFKGLETVPMREAMAHLAEQLINHAAELESSRIDFSTIADAIEAKAATPAISSVLPSEVALADLPGRTIEIRGQGFGTDRDLVAVTVGEFETTVLEATDTLLRVAITDASVEAGTHLVKVTVDTGDPAASPVALTLLP